MYKAADAMFRDAIARKVDAIILAGDTFDATKPPALAVWTLQRLVMTAKAAGVRVVGIDGNHDTCDSHWLKVCGVEILHVSDSDADTVKDIGGVKFIGIPATRPLSFYKTLDSLAERGLKADVLVIHQAVNEFCGFAADLSADEIADRAARLGVRYVAMGDIHAYHETVVKGIRFCYPGSLEITALDENPMKTYTLVEVRPEGVTTQSVQVPHRNFVTYELPDEESLGGLMKIAGDSRNAPVMIVRYKLDNRDLAKRAEAVLGQAEIMYRMYAVQDTDTGLREKIAKVGFERRGAIAQLKQAVEAFFDPVSIEYQLVFQCLENPDNTKDIINKYLKENGL
jgi:DNA repair exonuclease SbcCD nuclease subunit